MTCVRWPDPIVNVIILLLVASWVRSLDDVVLNKLRSADVYLGMVLVTESDEVGCEPGGRGRGFARLLESV